MLEIHGKQVRMVNIFAICGPDSSPCGKSVRSKAIRILAAKPHPSELGYSIACFSTAEEAKESILRNWVVDIIWYVNHERVPPLRLVPDIGILGRAITGHPNKPWLVLDKSSASKTLVGSIFGSWGIDIKVEKFLNAVAQRFDYQRAQTA